MIIIILSFLEVCNELRICTSELFIIASAIFSIRYHVSVLTKLKQTTTKCCPLFQVFYSSVRGSYFFHNYLVAIQYVQYSYLKLSRVIKMKNEPKKVLVLFLQRLLLVLEFRNLTMVNIRRSISYGSIHSGYYQSMK